MIGAKRNADSSMQGDGIHAAAPQRPAGGAAPAEDGEGERAIPRLQLVEEQEPVGAGVGVEEEGVLERRGRVHEGVGGEVDYAGPLGGGGKCRLRGALVEERFGVSE